MWHYREIPPKDLHQLNEEALAAESERAALTADRRSLDIAITDARLAVDAALRKGDLDTAVEWSMELQRLRGYRPDLN
jgi:hypothetical protein